MARAKTPILNVIGGISIIGAPSLATPFIQYDSVNDVFIYVASTAALALGGLTDVTLTAPADGNTILFDTVDSLWKNQAMSGDITQTKAGVTTIGLLKVLTTMLNNLAITTAKIANNAVTLAKIQQIATSSFIGRITAATGNAEVLTGTQATSLLDVFTDVLKGLVPLSGGGTTTFLRADGTFAVPASAGLTLVFYSAFTFNKSGGQVRFFPLDTVDGFAAVSEGDVDQVQDAAVTIKRAHLVATAVPTTNSTTTLRDDAGDAVQITATASTSADYDTGVITTVIAAGSLVDFEMDAIGTGTFIGVMRVIEGT